MRTNFPQLGEEPVVQRLLEVRDTRRAARAALLTDHTLDHANVSSAPEQQTLVELDEIFEQEVEIIVLLGIVVDAPVRLDEIG